MPRVTETIEWIPISEDLPDDDLTVLVECRDDCSAEPRYETWPGFLDSGVWHCTSGGRLVGVIAWAEMPVGHRSASSKKLGLAPSKTSPDTPTV